MPVKRRLVDHRHAAIALALTCMSGLANAEGPGDSFWAELSYFYPQIRSTARLDLTDTSRPGTVVTLEDDLNLDDRKGTPYVTLGMRLGASWRLEFEYYRLNRSASKSISRQIEWGDTTFPVGAQIDSTFDTTVYRLTGGYSFLQMPNAEAGVSLGLHVTDLTTELAGTGTGPSGTITLRREARDTLVPLPTIGLYGVYKLSDQWRLRGEIDYLTLKYRKEARRSTGLRLGSAAENESEAREIAAGWAKALRSALDRAQGIGGK